MCWGLFTILWFRELKSPYSGWYETDAKFGQDYKSRLWLENKVQITLLLQGQAGLGETPTGSGGTGLCLARDGHTLPHDVQRHHLMLVACVATSFNYHPGQWWWCHHDTLANIHTPSLDHSSAPCFLCPGQSNVVTQFCVLILPHHSKNMKHAHHLFMARVYRCRAIWDRGGRVIDCLQPAPCLRWGSDFNELIKIIIITIINVIIGGVRRPSEWNTGQG